MRNFAQVSPATFQTYTINGGEYVSDDVLLDIGKVVSALGAAFETDISAMKRAWSDACNGAEFSNVIAASEYRVLQELFEFAHLVRISICEDGATTKTSVFSYSNLNTGKVVTWVHFVS